MIPIKDNVPSRTFPVVTVGLIVVNILIFIVEYFALGPLEMRRFTLQYGLVPVVLREYALGGGIPAGQAITPLVTSIFLHGGLVHVVGNMWYLWIFGDNVEDRLGHFRFLVFFITCGVIGNLAHYAFNSSSMIPTIGASGAVAGVLGVYLVSYPSARVLVLIPVFFFLHFVNLPALVVLGFWIVLQFLNGAASVVFTQATGGVAWWAHIGGFMGGILIFKLFRPRPKIRYIGARSDY
jgi:hypothetical protein